MEQSIFNSGTLRSLTSLSPDELRSHEEKFLADANNILLLQKEVTELQEQLDNVMENTQKREFQHGHVVDFENVIMLKQITDVLRPRRKALRKQIRRLYWDLFPGDMFIDQHFFETWVRLQSNWVIRFSYDLEEMRLEVESANN